MPRSRPAGVAALAVFFAVGALIAATAAVSLATHAPFFEPMWRLNPRARTAFAGMGAAAPLLLAAVALACAAAAVGLWRGARWGHRTAVALLAINLLGDFANTLSGREPRAAVGIPIAGLLLAYLAARKTREHFGRAARL